MPAFIRCLIGWTLRVTFLMIIIVAVADVVVNIRTQSHVFTEVDSLPTNKTALLLGTIKTLSSGQNNLYFFHRIDAAVQLFKAGKIENIVVSGDNHTAGYNEPEDMKNELISRGVPPEKIYCDYAGFRTLDSVIRMWKIFGQTKFTIISQPFHIKRAVFIARAYGLDAVGFAATDVTAYNGFKTKVREKFARVKLFIDLFLNISPRFLGDPIEIK